MPKWDRIEAGIINLDKVQSAADAVEDVLEPIVSVLEVVLAILDLVAIILFAIPSALQAIVAAVIATIEAILLDLLQNNASIAVHANLNWNDNWKYRRKRGDPNRIVDFVNDGQLPIRGTGTSGWLLDLASSAYDETNPFRPYSDEDTKIPWGMLALKGITYDGDIGDLIKLYNMFTDFSAFKEPLEELENMINGVPPPKELLAMMRLGPGAFRKKRRDAERPWLERMGEAAAGNIIVTGTFGVNEANTTLFSDFVSDPNPFQGIQAGDVLKIAGEDAFYTVIGQQAVETLVVEPPIRRAHGEGFEAEWTIRRGGMATVLADISQNVEGLAPWKPGNLPVWFNAPLASLIPVIGQIIDKLRELLDALLAGLSALDAMRELIALIREKIALLEALILELIELIGLVVALLAFLEESYIFVHSTEDGGVGKFINDALAAEEIPYFGEEGLVVGFAIVTTLDGPANHVKGLFEMIGIAVDEYSDTYNAAEQNVDDTWGEAFGDPPP
jgi:hypothetical protein